MSWVYLWNRIKAVPAGIWAALGVAAALLLMYLRGRRLEAELAETKFKMHAADAATKTARNEERALVHMEAAAKHETKAEELEKQHEQIKKTGEFEQKRIAALAPKAITSEYLKLAAEEKNK